MWLSCSQIAYWVAAEILQTRGGSKQAEVVRHFLATATEFVHLNNYNTLMAIMMRLNLNPVQRLKRLWTVRHGLVIRLQVLIALVYRKSSDSDPGCSFRRSRI